MKKYELVELLVEKGLLYVAVGLEKDFGAKLKLIDDRGVEHYPAAKTSAKETDWNLIKRLPKLTDEEYYYEKNHKNLVMQVSSKGAALYILVEKVAAEKIINLMKIMADYRLALKQYLSTELKLVSSIEENKRKLLESLFVRGSLSFDELAEELGLSLDGRYAVMLTEFAGENKLKERDFQAIVREFNKLVKGAEIHPTCLGESYVAVLSVREDNSLGLDDRALALWHEKLAKNLDSAVNVGVGGVYGVKDIAESYSEAQMAINFHTIRGKENVVQCFDNLGIFRELFRYRGERLAAFCHRTLSKLLEYDHNFDGDLRITLGAFLSTNFNYKLTAEKLYVHTNTVRYRIEKIEQVLGIDLDDPDNRFNLYAAIRVGNVLQRLDLLQPGYVGHVGEVNKSGHKEGHALL